MCGYSALTSNGLVLCRVQRPQTNMGKKHKKHHKSEKNPDDVPATTRDLIAEPPLKLVLKVGSKSQDAGRGPKFDICVSKPVPPPQPLPPPESKPSLSLIEGGQRQQQQQQRKKKKKKRKWHEAESSVSEVEREVPETESLEEEEEEPQPPAVEAEESEEEKSKPLLGLGSKKKSSKKQRHGEEDLDRSKVQDTSSMAGSLPTPTQDSEVQRRAAAILEKETIEAMKVPLKKVLDCLQKTIQRKDVDQFFAWPVNDVIAPGYSSIIQHPLDFSTMKKKIDAFQYTSIEEYKSDFLLMCENATIYNRPETIYYKAAKRLQSVGLKCMGKEKLSSLKRTFGYLESSSAFKLRMKASKRQPQSELEGSTEESSAMEAGDSEDGIVPVAQGSSSIDLDPDEDTPEEIIEQVLQAAKGARDRLTARCPDSKLGFLRRDKAGTTTLAILNPRQHGVEETKEVNLGMLTGRLSQGTGSLPGFREDKRNKAIPVTYMAHGPFNSYGPQYDSSFANISKEDSDLLYATYGDEAGVQYAQSIKDYVEGCDDYVMTLVDNLLDTLTKGQHSKTIAQLQNDKQESEKALTTDGSEPVSKAAPPTGPDVVQTAEGGKESSLPPIHFDSLRSLSELGVDMSFLPTFEKLLADEAAAVVDSDSAEIDSKLKSTSDLIGDLERSQSARLSQKPPNHLQYVPKPSEQENSIAEKLTHQLLQLTAKIKPSDIVSAGVAQSAMGIMSPDIHSELMEEAQALDSTLTSPGLAADQHSTLAQ